MDFRDTVKQTTLTNGLTVITDTIPGNLMKGQLVVHTGSRHDPIEKLGLAHFAEHLISHAVPGYSDIDFNLVNDNRALVEYNLGTDEDHTTYFASGRPQAVLDYLSDMIAGMTNLDYTPELVQLEKTRIVTEMANNLVNKDRQKYKYQRTSLFGDTPMSLWTGGVPETLSQITYEDIKRFHHENHQGNNMSLFVSGPMVHEDVVQWASEILGHFDSGYKRQWPLNGMQTKDVLVENSDYGNTVEFEIRFPIFDSYNTEIRASMEVLMKMLAPKIKQEVSDKYGLYGVSFYLTNADNTLPFVQLETTCQSDMVKLVIADILNNIDGWINDIDSDVYCVRAALEQDKSKILFEAFTMNALGRGDNIKNFSLSAKDPRGNNKFIDSYDSASLDLAKKALRSALSQKPGTFYYGAITKDLPTGEMIQRRDFSGRGQRPAVITRFKPV